MRDAGIVSDKETTSLHHRGKSEEGEPFGEKGRGRPHIPFHPLEGLLNFSTFGWAEDDKNSGTGMSLKITNKVQEPFQRPYLLLAATSRMENDDLGSFLITQTFNPKKTLSPILILRGQIELRVRHGD